MVLYKIIIFARGESSKQDEDSNWFDIVWYKFEVPEIHFRGRIELEKKKDNWGQMKKAIKEKLIEQLESLFELIEYEEEI